MIVRWTKTKLTHGHSPSAGRISCLNNRLDWPRSQASVSDSAKRAPPSKPATSRDQNLESTAKCSEDIPTSMRSGVGKGSSACISRTRVGDRGSQQEGPSGNPRVMQSFSQKNLKRWAARSSKLSVVHNPSLRTLGQRYLGVSRNVGHRTWTQKNRTPLTRTPKQDP